MRFYLRFYVFSPMSWADNSSSCWIRFSLFIKCYSWVGSKYVIQMALFMFH